MNPLRGNLAIRVQSKPFDASLCPTLRSLAGAIIHCAAPFVGAVGPRRLTTDTAPLFEYQPLNSSAEIVPIQGGGVRSRRDGALTTRESPPSSSTAPI